MRISDPAPGKRRGAAQAGDRGGLDWRPDTTLHFLFLFLTSLLLPTDLAAWPCLCLTAYFAAPGCSSLRAAVARAWPVGSQMLAIPAPVGRPPVSRRCQTYDLCASDLWSGAEGGQGERQTVHIHSKFSFVS